MEHFTLHNCILPKELLYETKNHLWLREEDNKTYTVGITDMAQTMAGKVLHFRPWKPGSLRPANKPLAMLEAAKWLGVIRLPFAVEIVDYNIELEKEAFLINQFPYHHGWIIRVRPQDEVEARNLLLNAEQAYLAYRQHFKDWNLTECVHCVGFEV